MGRKNRELKLKSEWLNNYCKEATGIIIDCLNVIQDDVRNESIVKRIKRLKAASAVWDEIQKNKDKFVP